jgi:hypothetical protein
MDLSYFVDFAALEFLSIIAHNLFLSKIHRCGVLAAFVKVGKGIT